MRSLIMVAGMFTVEPAPAWTQASMSAAIVTEVAKLAAASALPSLVVDPVLVSSTGHPLMEPDGVAAYMELLLPHALVATPNLREAAVLAGIRVEEIGTVEAISVENGTVDIKKRKDSALVHPPAGFCLQGTYWL